jgi:hypothetical protein
MTINKYSVSELKETIGKTLYKITGRVTVTVLYTLGLI